MAEVTSMKRHKPASIVVAGAKFRAVCHCGWRSSPRTTARRALEAIECEHGWTGDLWPPEFMPGISVSMRDRVELLLAAPAA